MKTNLIVCLLLLTCVTHAQQTSKQLTSAGGKLIGFLEYKPTDYQQFDKTKSYPLIIFLHGIGERGNGTTELSRVSTNGIPKYIKYGNPMRFTWNGKTETFLVLSPQLSTEYGSWPNFYVDEMIKYAKSNMNIDTNRIILAGLSLGGGGVWYYAAADRNNTKKLAAIGISCGTKRSAFYNYIAEENLPTKAFHAMDDAVVPVSNTTSIIQTINDSKPAVSPYQTIWPTGGHTIWDRAFDTSYNTQNPSIYEWFLAQNKSYKPNIRPVAYAGKNINTITATGSAILNASGSRDFDGSILRYVWRQISGPIATALSSPVSSDGICNVSGATLVGNYSYEVKVIDNRADYTMDTVDLSVIDDQLPISAAGLPQTIMQPASTVVLNGSASSDPDGQITRYLWSQVSGPTISTISNPDSAISSVSDLQAGQYSFRLTVTDNSGASSISFTTVTVNQPTNLRPTAKAGNDDTLFAPITSVILDGSNSYDRDGKIVQYKWLKLLGPSSFVIESAASATTTVSNLVEGSYKFRLIVYDDRGDSAMDNHYVVIKSAVTVPAMAVKSAAMEAKEATIQSRLFPNPAIASTIIEYNAKQQGKAEISIYTEGGQLVKSAFTQSVSGLNRYTMLLGSLNKGCYQLKVSCKNEKPIVHRLIIK